MMMINTACFLLVTGLARAVPSRSFLVTGQKFCVIFRARASQISNRLKTVDYYWCGESSNQLLCSRHVIPPNPAHRATFNGFSDISAVL